MDVFFPGFFSPGVFFFPLSGRCEHAQAVQHTHQMLIFRGWVMISGAVTEVCGSQMSFDGFDELQAQSSASPRLGESRFCQSWDKVWD